MNESCPLLHTHKTAHKATRQIAHIKKQKNSKYTASRIKEHIEANAPHCTRIHEIITHTYIHKYSETTKEEDTHTHTHTHRPHAHTHTDTLKSRRKRKPSASPCRHFFLFYFFFQFLFPSSPFMRCSDHYIMC